MNHSIWGQLFLQLILIALNAVFACAEIAVLSMNDAKLQKLAAQGDKRALRLARLTSQPARFLATIQVAITLSGFLGSAFAADHFSDVLTQGLLSLGLEIPEKTLDTVAVVVITLLLSYLTLVFGELVPKRIAMKKAEKLALALSGLVTAISKIFAPLVGLLTLSTNGLLRLMGIDPDSEDSQVTEEEIRMLVDAGGQKGAIDPEERDMIQNVFRFDDLTAGEIATHRREVDLLWLEDSPQQWEQKITASRHGRLPVCQEKVDNVVGILSAKAYFRLKDRSRETVMARAVGPAFFVPESVRADLLFQKMRRTGHSFAVVLDERGGLQGILTLSDLIEQIVGDLGDDGGGAEPPELQRLEDGAWQIRGSARLEDVAQALGLELPEEAREFDTFGGYIFGALGTIPADGSQLELTLAGLRIRVVEIREHRIMQTLCRREDGGEAER